MAAVSNNTLAIDKVVLDRKGVGYGDIDYLVGPIFENDLNDILFKHDQISEHI